MISITALNSSDSEFKYEFKYKSEYLPPRFPGDESGELSFFHYKDNKSFMRKSFFVCFSP